MKKWILIVVVFACQAATAQNFYSGRFAHTYSIVAIDSVNGEIGAAVQSHWFSVGSLVIWAESGVGAVATQSFVNPEFGPLGLHLMKSGHLPENALKMMLSGDEGREFRQVALIDTAGHSAAFTGSRCVPEAGHISRHGFSVQANLMKNETVWPAMEKAFRESSGPLAERMLSALMAAEAEGGDIRGRQSAAMLVVKLKPSGKPWQDRLVDLRVEDHPQPLQELKRLLQVHRAYEHMNAGDLAIERGDEAAALREYSAAETLQPDNLEMKYWHAVSLANIGKVEESLPLFREIFRADENWRILTPRLREPGMLKVSDNDFKKIMATE
ncbi:MAG: DUF1028 domain-containing protein [Calditrichia bacterium]